MIYMALQFLTDEAGQKTAVVLSVGEYERMMEDLSDLAEIANRREEPTIPHTQFIHDLKVDGILSD